ncbi:MAG: hypothetical protein ABW321_14140 [Polyangiales bacterium]
MCPACWMAAAMVAAKVASGSALGVLTIKKLHATLRPASEHAAQPQSQGGQA